VSFIVFLSGLFFKKTGVFWVGFNYIIPASV